MNNVFKTWIQENLNRLFTKKPKFFVYWQWIMGLLASASGLPTLVNSALVFFNVKALPPAWTSVELKIVAAAATGFFWASQLTTASPVATVTKDGAVLKQTDSDKLPFTAQVEVTKAQQDLVPNAAVTLADVKKPA